MDSSLTISEYSTNSILVSVGGSNQMGLELKDFFTEQGGFYNNKLGGFLFHKSKKDMLRRIIESGIEAKKPDHTVERRPSGTERGGWFLTKDEYLALIGRIEFLELALKKSQNGCPYGASFKVPKSPQSDEAGTKPDRTERKRGNNEIIKRFLSKN